MAVKAAISHSFRVCAWKLFEHEKRGCYSGGPEFKRITKLIVPLIHYLEKIFGEHIMLYISHLLR